MSTTTLSLEAPELRAALAARATKLAEASRPDLAVGEHRIDTTVTLRVQGTLRVGRPTITAQLNKVSPWILLGAALSKLNAVTVEAFVADVVQRLDAGQPVADEEATKASVERVLGSLRAMVKTERAGSVRFDGDVTAVEG